MSDLLSALMGVQKRRRLEDAFKGPLDPHGFPIDLSRQVLKNPDGSISTEETMTERVDGRFMNIPTIFGGQRMAPGQAMGMALQQMGQGAVFPNFGTLDEALDAARRRSEFLGQLRRFNAMREAFNVNR